MKKDYLIQVTMYGVVIVAILAGLWWLEQQRRVRDDANQPVPRLLRERELARGSARAHEYLRDEIVRVTEFAAAKTADGDWIVLAPDSLLRVVQTRMDNDEPWISVKADEALPLPRLASGTLSADGTMELHSSFLEKWRAVNVDGLLEVAGYKLLETSFMGSKGNIVRGLLRNTGSADLRDCTVTAKFLDSDDKVFAERQSKELTIRPREIVEFKTQALAAKFERLTLHVAFTDGEGKRRESEAIPLLALPKAP
jgi:hypothetical protein